jgi:dTMP kinase
MFITFEGIDFCGKSTQVILLKEYLERNGETVKLIREPGGTEISEEIRKILLDIKNSKMVFETEFLLFSAARSQLVREVIRPTLDKNYFVISDRFHDSSTVYQGYGRGISLEAIAQIHKLAIGNTIPDVTFILDIPLDEAERRKKVSTNINLDRIENSHEKFFQKVRKGYLELSKTEKRFRLIDGMLPVDVVHNKILSELKNFKKLK